MHLVEGRYIISNIIYKNELTGESTSNCCKLSQVGLVTTMRGVPLLRGLLGVTDMLVGLVFVKGCSWS